MKRLIISLTAFISSLSMLAQTLNIEVSNLVYQFPALQTGEMTYNEGKYLTIMDKVFTLSEITGAWIDLSNVTDSVVYVKYSESGKTRVYIPGKLAQYIDGTVNSGHVTLNQSNTVGDETSGEITYSLSGVSSDGEFYMTGSYKASIELNGITLTNPEGAAINIQDGKRINVSIKRDTENTITDGTGHSDKGCFVSKGHTEFKGHGILNVYGNSACGLWSKEYIEIKNCTINIQKAAKDGVNCNQSFTMESGSLTIKNVGDDGIQVSYEDDGTDEEDTGTFTLEDGTINLTVSGDACKGIKADKNIIIKGGILTINQSGSLTTTETDINYPTSMKADGDINVSGGTINITNTAEGGKGMSADGSITIDESDSTTIVTVAANGKGGTVELSGNGSSDEEEDNSYVVYISLPTSGGGGGPGGGGSQAWKNPVLYNSNGTMISTLTNTVTKSNGYNTTTFYYYDFKDADTNVSYYIKGDNYNSRGTTYTIRSATFNAPTNGSDVYYSISNSYTTSGTTRTYSITNVTNTYSGSTDVSEESGEGYNAIGIKADGDITIGGGTIKVLNSGTMSKSLKSKATTTINGGDITLTPSGAMLVNGSDASYSTGIKTKEFVQNDGTLTITSSGQAGRGISATNITTNGGTLTITNTGAGVQGGSDNYTAKCIKGDTSVKLLAGTITLKATGTGGKGIKSSGTFVQGTSDGNGPIFSVTTTGSSLGGSGGGGFPGQQSSGGSSAKGVKVQGTATIYGGTSTYSTATSGGEGLETKSGNIDIRGGHHYFKCYDDCINSAYQILFNGGVTICYSNGNDAVDSNYGLSGAITIGNGAAMAYTSKGSPEEGFDCDNNSYIQITGTGIGISAGGSQGGGGGWGGSSSSTISNAAQGYYLSTTTISFNSSYYYTISDENGGGNNLVTFKFPATISSSLSLLTAKGMVKGNKYYLSYSSTKPTDATTEFQGMYIGCGSVNKGTNVKFGSYEYFTAQ